MYVIVSTFVLLYHAVNENTTQEKFIRARVSDSFTTIVLKTFFTESDSYVFICVFCMRYKRC